MKILKNDVEIEFCSADHRGFGISKARVEDMGFKLSQVPIHERFDWINKRFPKDLYYQMYMGDSFVDAHILRSVDLGICPQNGDDYAKASADYITVRCGGDRAVAEAAFYIMQHILGKEVITIGSHELELDAFESHKIDFKDFFSNFK